MLGDINAKRDYVFIDDLVNAFVLAIATKGSIGVSTYNICTGIGKSAAEIVKIISKIKRVAMNITSNSSLIRPDEMNEEYGSYAKAKKEFGWTPKIGLAEGLTKLLQ